MVIAALKVAEALLQMVLEGVDILMVGVTNAFTTTCTLLLVAVAGEAQVVVLVMTTHTESLLLKLLLV